MAELTIKLTERAAEAWAERARREGHATAGDAVGAWAEREAEDIKQLDPSEVAIVRERLQRDPVNDTPFAEAIGRLAARHGIELPTRGHDS